jgi:uncharacterized membrane protein
LHDKGGKLKRFIDFWKNIRYSLWLMPAVIVFIAIAMALIAVDIDTGISKQALSGWPHIFGSSADGARAILQVIAGAMMTVAAMTFSITVLVLSLGASQYTPRIIRTFMGNRPTQAVLGVFVGIFAYCLVVLRTIRGGNDAFNPSIAVTLAIVLALVGVGFLVYFIHHIASSIQASAIASSVAADTIHAIEKIYPDHLTDQAERDGQRDRDDMKHRQWYPVISNRTGYVQTVDLKSLTAFAVEHSLTVRMEKPVGAFVADGLTIASVDRPPHDEMVRKLNQAYTISHYRTLELDAASGIRQLVDIALKAMSPAMNDTTTAVMCIDFLSAIMIKLAPRCIVADPCFSDGALKVLTNGICFEDFMNEAFVQIREYAQENTAIYVALLHAFETIANATTNASRKAYIREQVALLMTYARRYLRMHDQRERVEKDHLKMLSALQH